MLDSNGASNYANLPAALTSALLNLPTNIYIDSSLQKYNYSASMLTAELLRRNHRLNQEPIVEEDDDKQKTTLKLKRRI